MVRSIMPPIIISSRAGFFGTDGTEVELSETELDEDIVVGCLDELELVHNSKNP